MRACRFSSVRSGSRPANGSASAASKACIIGSIGSSSSSTPRFSREPAARRRACPREEYGDGIVTHVTQSGPSASTAIERDERRVDPAAEAEHDALEAVLARVVARAEHERAVDLVDVVEQRRDLSRSPSGASLGRSRTVNVPSSSIVSRAAAAGARRRVSRRRAEPAATVSTSAISSASSNCGARASTVPSWSTTTE